MYSRTGSKPLSPLIWLPLALGVWSVFLFANAPAVISPDGLDQWRQLTKGAYDDWHPVFHTLFLKSTSLIYVSPLMPIIGHIAMMVLALWYALYSLHRFGLCIRGQTVVVASYALFPTIGSNLCYLVKDVPFGILSLVFTCSITRVTVARNDCNRTDWLALSASGLGLTLFRHNGLVCVLASIGATYLALKNSKFKRPLTLSVIFIAVLWLAAKFGTHRLLNAPPPRVTEALAIPIQQVAAVVVHEGTLSPPQRDLIAEVLPLDSIKRHYHPTSVDSLKFLPGFNREIIQKNPVEFLKLWVSACIANPGRTLKAWIHQTQIAWSPRFNAASTFPSGIFQNELGLKPWWPDSQLSKRIHKLYEILESPALAWLFRPYLIHAFLLLLALHCLRRWAIGFLAAFVPALSNLGLLFLLIPTPDYRYFLPGLFSLPFLFGFVFAMSRKG